MLYTVCHTETVVKIKMGRVIWFNWYGIKPEVSQGHNIYVKMFLQSAKKKNGVDVRF